ncbi:cytoplasmic protein [Bacillus cereus BAG1X2-3]|uniref:Cytoplasmic protein n=3 Tax=Bacillus cereus group TaxID=86661 RepID=A0A9X7E2F5_BACCE|nr:MULTISPECIES: YdcF family protein [Bacillus]EOO26608.1 cytoplasmic protein [Bacillus cereus BAG1X1-1]EOO50553.1 cytoplasmic protein [Bacillus cereus BAG1X2-2]EOO50784.1 cytoplasmic protein [Bacillus cereus BAG1X2-1]EOO60983.1 cytoplasmic protein [Bacillus cereus BAG1X2-3]EOP07490.1 cytoplasmic protein [Bacillus cereus BAG2O-1]
MRKKRIIKCILVVIMICAVYAGFLQYHIYKHGHMNASDDAEYIIVLGSKVNGTKPSYSLQYRIDKAAEYLKSHEKTIAIVSGGQGKGEDISEALAMKQGLIKQNIAEDRIIMEDKSTSTDENITFSKPLIPADMKKGMIVTNDFHMFRAKKIAAKQGLQLEGLPAKTPKPIIIPSNVREYLAITQYWFMNRI